MEPRTLALGVAWIVGIATATFIAWRVIRVIRAGQHQRIVDKRLERIRSEYDRD